MKVIFHLFAIAFVLFGLSGCGEGNSVLDTQENRCSASLNPGAADQDGDGIINICDTDNDNDGIDDAVDNCPYIPNAAQADENDDGVGDDCDADHDGIVNDEDNCPQFGNPQQEDFNNDGVGDICDRDGDAIYDETDNCPIDPNSSQDDTDGDGLGDACDMGEGAEIFSFYAPLNLSENPGLTFRPSVAFDKRGYIHTVWDDNTGIEGALEVYFSYTMANGLTKSEPIQLSNSQSGAVGLAQRPKVDVAPDGVVHVVWQDTKSDYSDIFYVQLALNEAESTFNIVSGNGAGDNPEQNISNTSVSSTDPDIAISPEGYIYIAWSSDEKILFSRSTDGGSTFTGSEALINFDIVINTVPALFAGENGVVWLAWTAADSVYVTKSEDFGGTFSDPRILVSSEHMILRPDIEAFGDRVYVVWDEEGEDKAKPELYLMISEDGGETFKERKNLTNNDGTSIYGSIKVGPTGHLFVAWSDTTSGNYETLFCHSEDGGVTFTEPVIISPSDNGSLVVDMDVDDNNNVAVVWDDNRYDSFDIILAYAAEALPLIRDLSVIPDFYDPSSEAPMIVSAALSEFMFWSLTIRNEDDTIVYYNAESGTGFNEVWDGTNLDGEMVPEGFYYYTISARNNDVFAISQLGEIHVIEASSSERTPQIETLLTDRAAFSPNGDGRTDTLIVNTTFNQRLDWTLTLTDVYGEVYTSESGTGPSGLMEWDGFDANGDPMPEGEYIITAKVKNAQGETAESSVSVFIDLTHVFIEDLTITPVNRTEGTSGNISFHITESAVVTIYIFDEAGFTTVNELVRTQLGGGYDGEEGAQNVSYDWDGKSGNGIDQPPGTYTLRIWVRDFGANLPVEYPMLREIEIIE